ncbi:MAG: GAF domain-containing protein [Desulfocapsaceae bacterium]|nr:GAF domain-containing protein [Desulfocapsaceae bacterium]
MLVKTQNLIKNRQHHFKSFSSTSVFYRLTMAFGLFFLGPLLGLLFISIKTDLFGTNELLYSLVGLLISTLFGYVIIRQISGGISRLEHRLASKLDYFGQPEEISENELKNISLFADILDENFKKTGESLNRRINEIHALQELGGLSAYQVTARSLALTALEKSTAVTEAAGGVIVFITGKHGVCSLKKGRGIKIVEKQTFAYDDFPWKDVVENKKPMFIQDEEMRLWRDFFSSSCSHAAIIPFGSFGSTKAVAILAGEKKKGWDETTFEFLNTYFLGIGNALKMQEIDVQKRETAHELNTVLSLIKILHTNPGDSDLLTVVAQKVEEIIPYHWIGLAIYDEDQQNLYLSHSFSKFAPEIQTGQRIPKTTSLFHHAMHASETITIDNLMSKREYFEKDLFGRLGLKSCIFASLNNGGKATGAICLASEKTSAFGRREKRMFAMVAMGVAIAIEQSRLFHQEKTKRAELEVLNKIGAALTSYTIRANEVLDHVLDRIAEFIEVEAGSIMLLEFDALVIEAAMGKFSKQLLKQRIGFDQGVAGYVVATGEPVIVADARDYTHFSSVVDERTGFETRNLLCVPLIAGGQVVGVIELINSINKPFSEDDKQVLKTVAAATAMALENTRLYQESTYIAKNEKFIRTIFQKYVPEEIVSKILEKGESDQMAVSEKKLVTVFNVDIRGYTKMSKQASTEDVVKILNQFFHKMGNIIINHHGLVDKYLGDGMLAIFGAPVSTANPPLDAVRAAQEMIGEIEKLSILCLDRCGVPLKIGISINTGEAIVGNIGFSKKMEYTVIGDVVNEVFRLQDLTRSKANSILISESTYDQVKNSIKTCPHGLQKLDSSLVNVYEVETDSFQEDSSSQMVRLAEGTAKIH